MEEVEETKIPTQDNKPSCLANGARRYHNDYAPRYRKPYDIYDKARNHIKTLKQAEKTVEDKG